MATLDTIYDTYARIRQWIEDEVNFFRLHLIFFTVTPLIAACIFYGVNGEFHIRECQLYPSDWWSWVGWQVRLTHGLRSVYLPSCYKPSPRSCP